MLHLTKVRNVNNNAKSRAVAPVIATLLLVAIAVVGGTIIFVYSQGFFSQAQISGTPTIESVKVLGYDASDSSRLRTHDDRIMLRPNSGGDEDGINEQHERIAVFVQNDSVETITLSEVSFGGTIYQYADAHTLQPVHPASTIPGGEFDVWLERSAGHDVLLTEPTCELLAGQAVTLIIALDSTMKIGRDTQLKLTTTNGAVFVDSVMIGQQIGVSESPRD